MKKKVLIFVLVVIVLSCAIPVVQGIAAMIENARSEKENVSLLAVAIGTEKMAREDISANVAINRTNKWDKQGLKDFLAEKGYYVDDIDIAINKYINASIMYNMTDAENEYIMTLVKKDYDFEKLIDVYSFTKNTGAGIAIMRDIYDAGRKSGFLKHWMEDAYETLLYGEGSELSYGDVSKYIQEGIIADEILMAFELSLKGTASTRQILDDKLSGKAWHEVVAGIYGEDGVTVATFEGVETLGEINYLLLAARQTNRPITDAIENSGDRIYLNSDTMTVLASKRQEIQAAKEAMNLKAADDETFKVTVKEKHPDLPDEEIDMYFAQGYRIRDIEAQVESDKVLAEKDAERLERVLEEKQDLIKKGGVDL